MNVQKHDLSKDSPSNIQNQHFVTENNRSSSSIPPSLNTPGGPICDMKFEANLFPPIYDLLGVSNHCGTMNGGHYIAHVDTNTGIKCYRKHRRNDMRCDEGDVEESDRTTEESDNEFDDNSAIFNDLKHSGVDSGGGERDDDARWMCFNDEHVTSASTANIIGPSAYVLFYRLREVE
jgi:ubiquitin C-terminal hydrolase